MKNFLCSLAFLLAGLALAACGSRPSGEAEAAQAGHPEAHASGASGTVTVTRAWMRSTAGGATVGAAYFTITNSTAAAETLLSVESPASARAELHQTVMEGDMTRMRPVGEVPVPAGQSVKAEPGGLHVMLLELRQPLTAGTRVPLELNFRHAGTVKVQADVVPVTAAPDHAGHTLQH